MAMCLYFKFMDIVERIYNFETDAFIAPKPPENPTPIEAARFRDQLEAYTERMVGDRE